MDSVFPRCVFLIAVKTLYNFMLSLPEYISKATGVIEQMFIFCKAKVYIPDSIYELFVFSLCAYFIGLILHEISSIFKSRVMYKEGKPVDFLLDSYGEVFDEEQINALMPMYIRLYEKPFTLNDREKLKKESRIIFRKINAELQRKKIANQYVKLNIVYNTCATLGVATMLILCMIALFEVEFIFLKRYDALFSVTVLDVLLVICIYFFISRSKKYYKYWVQNIVLAYQDIYLDTNMEA